MAKNTKRNKNTKHKNLPGYLIIVWLILSFLLGGGFFYYLTSVHKAIYSFFYPQKIEKESRILVTKQPYLYPQVTPVKIEKEESENKATVFMYHHVKVVDNPNNAIEMGLSVTPENFDKQLAYLSNNGYRFVTLKDAVKRIKTGGQFTKKTAVITFDDGYDDVYANAHPILKKYNAPATVFVITNYVDQPRYMNKQQISELIDAGFEIGSHSLSHPNLANTSSTLVQKEIIESKSLIEKWFDIKVETFCYPSGKFSSATMQLLESADYSAAVTTVDGPIKTDSNLFSLNRIRVSGRYSLDKFIENLPN
jgi:peptidoglycan/xylan/chitin deacetylase (PgdA/CDA1 family)